MSPEQKQRRQAIFDADYENQYAVVELLTRHYLEACPRDANVYLRRARTLAMLNRHAEAEGSVEQALDVIADEKLMPFVWTVKAAILERQGRFLEAEQAYVEANALEPNQCWLLCLLAHMTWMGGDLPLAEQRFREALAVEGEEHDEAFYNLGGVLVALGRLEEAADCYRQALALSPDYDIARVRLTDVERALELQREADG